MKCYNVKFKKKKKIISLLEKTFFNEAENKNFQRHK